MTPTDFAGLLTFEQCAVELEGSRTLVENLVKRGELSVVKLGNRCVRIERYALDAYLARQARRRTGR